MKSWLVILVLVLGICPPTMAEDQGAPPVLVTLVNTLADRPVFNYEVQGVVQTRTLAPGNRLGLPAGVFSGLGEKKLPFTAGTTYFLARLGAVPRVYRLPADQVLILNQSGLALAVTLEEAQPVTGILASGNLALGSVGDGGTLEVTWGAGTQKTQTATGGQVYRLVLDSPEEGTGTTVSLVPWD